MVTIKGVMMHPKPHDCGVTCMFAGYCVNREGYCYKMYDPISNNIYYTRDIIWMKRMYFPVIDAMGVRLDWMDEMTDDFIG